MDRRFLVRPCPRVTAPAHTAPSRLSLRWLDEKRRQPGPRIGTLADGTGSVRPGTTGLNGAPHAEGHRCRIRLGSLEVIAGCVRRGLRAALTKRTRRYFFET